MFTTEATSHLDPSVLNTYMCEFQLQTIIIFSSKLFSGFLFSMRIGCESLHIVYAGMVLILTLCDIHVHLKTYLMDNRHTWLWKFVNLSFARDSGKILEVGECQTCIFDTTMDIFMLTLFLYVN